MSSFTETACSMTFWSRESISAGVGLILAGISPGPLEIGGSRSTCMLSFDGRQMSSSGVNESPPKEPYSPLGPAPGEGPLGGPDSRLGSGIELG